MNLPAWNAFSESPNVAAGVPVLELVRKFEEEKILNREDRIALNEGLSDPERRDGIVKALRDLELGETSRFAIRRLKAQIHQNGIGEISSRAYKEQQERLKNIAAQQQHEERRDQEESTTATSDVGNGVEGGQPSNSGGAEGSPKAPPLKSTGGSNSPGKRRPGPGSKPGGEGDNRSLVSSSTSLYDTHSAIVEVVGAAPMYSDPDNFGICGKIARRLRDFLMKMKQAPGARRKFAVLVGEGSFNPLTRMHLRSYFVAKQYLEGSAGFIVLGSLLAPSHGMTVRERYRQHPNEIIPSPHRLAIAQLMVQESRWLAVDPWEITRRRPMDHLSLLQHTRETLAEQFPGADIKVLYLCKPNAVPLLSAAQLRQEGFGVVCPCRAIDYDLLKASLSAKWNGIIWPVEDTAVVDASMDVITSRRVRENVRSGSSVEHLVGTAIDQYFRMHHIGPKMAGTEEWTEEERKLPRVAARPFNFTLKSQEGKISSPSSQATPSYTPSWQQTPATTAGAEAPLLLSPLGGGGRQQAPYSSVGDAEVEVPILQEPRAHAAAPAPGTTASDVNAL
jgi:nicotinic acid mononucleotide adenylyltransferase